MELIAFRKKKDKTSLRAKNVAGGKPNLCCDALRRAKVGLQAHLEAAFKTLLCTYKISDDITQYQSVARDNPAQFRSCKS